MSVFGQGHISRVRIIYKAILKLHRGLPLDMRAIGDQYVRDEFRRHKTAEPQFVLGFMKEWTKYAHSLALQLGKQATHQTLGLDMDPKLLEDLNESQVGQLFELYQETQKPVDPDNPLGEFPADHQQSKNT